MPHGPSAHVPLVRATDRPSPWTSQGLAQAAAASPALVQLLTQSRYRLLRGYVTLTEQLNESQPVKSTAFNC